MIKAKAGQQLNKKYLINNNKKDSTNYLKLVVDFLVVVISITLILLLSINLIKGNSLQLIIGKEYVTISQYKGGDL